MKKISSSDYVILTKKITICCKAHCQRELYDTDCHCTLYKYVLIDWLIDWLIDLLIDWLIEAFVWKLL